MSVPLHLNNLLKFSTVLDTLPRLHSFCFFINGTEACPSLESTPDVIRDLRLRLKSISVLLFLEYEIEDKDEDSLQELRYVIAPHDGWRRQTCNDWPHSPTWRFDTPDVGPPGKFRLWSTTRPGWGFEEL